jgi:tetratricopeptide (TPR) repeat protein
MQQYLANELNESEKESFWEECLKSPELYDELVTSVHLKKIMEESPAEEDLEPRAKTFTLSPWFALAAAMVLIVLILQLFRFTEDDFENKYIADAIELSEVENINAFRSEGESLSDNEKSFSAAVSLSLSGNIDEAIEQFKMLAQNSDDDFLADKANLNLGILYFNQRKYDLALEAFTACLDADTDNRYFLEKAYWYHGLCLYRLDRLEDARTSIYEAYQYEGAYQDKAFRLLRFLDYKLGNISYEPEEEN